jgi:CPA2 family monovalent cation:H+ antiporter-2
MVLLAESEAVSRLGLYLLVLLGSAGLVAALFRRLRLELIPGYLLAGVIVGPHAVGLIPQQAGPTIDEISELATVLLLFSIGLDLDVGHIRRGMVHILAIGVVSTLVFTGLFWLLRPSGRILAPQAMVIAMAMAMSSTAVLVRILMNRREARSPVGRVTLGVAIVQDLASVIVMALIPPIAFWAGVPQAPMGDSTLPGWARLVATSAIGVGGVTSMIVVARFVLPRLLHVVARTGSNELVLVVSGAAALGAAVTTGWLGFSPQMGAFMAGFLLAGTPFRYQLAGQIAPMRDLLMAVFFTSVGLQVDPAGVLHDAQVIGIGVLMVTVLKVVVVGVTAWGAGMTAPSAFISGVYLANAGEFSLVILGAAASQHILAEHQLSAAIAVVIITLILSPMLVTPAHRWSEKLTGVRPARWIRTHALREVPTDALQPPQDGAAAGARACHVIIAGFGPVGRTLADRFAVLSIPFTVIELNPKTVERQAVIGRPIIYGDVTNPEVLESAGIRHADAIILTIADDEATLRACRAIRALAPDVFIAARTSFLSGKFIAHQLGADLVTVEELATAQAMEKEVLAKLGQWKREHESQRNGEAVKA